MELIIVAVVAGVILAAGLWAVLWKIVSAAVDNALGWLIHTFGNERAIREYEQRKRREGGAGPDKRS